MCFKRLRSYKTILFGNKVNEIHILIFESNSVCLSAVTFSRINYKNNTINTKKSNDINLAHLNKAAGGNSKNIIFVVKIECLSSYIR